MPFGCCSRSKIADPVHDRKDDLDLMENQHTGMSKEERRKIRNLKRREYYHQNRDWIRARDNARIEEKKRSGSGNGAKKPAFGRRHLPAGQRVSFTTNPRSDVILAYCLIEET